MHVYIISYMLYIEPYMYYISVTLILVGRMIHTSEPGNGRRCTC